MFGKRGFILAVSSVLYLALLLSCSPAAGDLNEDRIISLSIGGSPAPRFIGEVEIYDPDGWLLWDVEWSPEEGPQTYDIQVEMLGTHEIVVIHHGINGDDTTFAIESAEFSIASMLITVIGIWEGVITMMMEEYDDWGEVIDEYEFEALLRMTFDAEGNAEMLTFIMEGGIPSPDPMEDLSLRGTYECPEDGLVGGI